MFGKKKKNMVVFKVKNGLSTGESVELMAILEEMAVVFPHVTVRFELEGDFVHSAKKSDDRDDQSDRTDDA